MKMILTSTDIELLSPSLLGRAKHQRKYSFWPVYLECLTDNIFFGLTTKLCNVFHQTIDPSNHQSLLGRVTFLVVKYPFQLGARKNLLPVLQQLRTTRKKIKPQPINLHNWNEKRMLHDMEKCDLLLMERTHTWLWKETMLIPLFH